MSILEDIFFSKFCWCENIFDTTKYSFKSSTYQGCRNPSLGLVMNAKAYKGAGQKWSSGVTFHVPGSVGKYEGMNPHIPKWAPTLGIGVWMDSRIFKGQLQVSKLIELKSSLHN